MKLQKLLDKISRREFRNISFADFRRLVEAFGFRLDRVGGSHHIFQHPDLDEQVNLQSSKGQAKPYQVRQFLKLVERYNLSLEDK